MQRGLGSRAYKVRRYGKAISQSARRGEDVRTLLRFDGRCLHRRGHRLQEEPAKYINEIRVSLWLHERTSRPLKCLLTLCSNDFAFLYDTE